MRNSDFLTALRYVNGTLQNIDQYGRSNDGIDVRGPIYREMKGLRRTLDGIPDEDLILHLFSNIQK
jgi:hypothetical protein